MPSVEELKRLEGDLVDQGRLIEAGWIGLRAVWLHPDTPDDQVGDMRAAFFAGAQHLFTSIMSLLDPGEEPSDRDLMRMDRIDAELTEFIQAFELGNLPTEGRA